MISELHYHEQGHANELYHFKILVPSVSAGAIIGKRGGIIAQLQEDTGAKVKMSKATDFYPGTTERVCLISGKVDDILKIHEFIMLKIIERPDPSAKIAIDFDHKMPAGREKQVKILVPNSTASMIIGKSGSYIKQIKEESGSYIQISQNDKENHTLSERCITVIGDLENNKIACRMILAKIVKDPNNGRCLEVSYASVMGPVPNFDPIGSPFANPHNVSGGAMNNSDTSYDSYLGLGNLGPNLTSNFQRQQTDANASHSEIVPLTGIRMGCSAFPLANALQVIESIKTMLRKNGYSEQAIFEISAAMNTLAHYGLLGLDLGLLIGAPVSSGMTMTMPSPAGTSCPWPSGDITNQVTSVIDVPGSKAACNSAATPSLMTTPFNTPFNPTMSSGLHVAISDSETTNCSWSPGDMVNDDAAVTDVPGAEAAVATPGPMKFLSGMFDSTHSFGSELSELGIEPEFSSPTYSNEHFLARSETSMVEPFCRASLASPNAASLPVSADSFGLETKFVHPTLKENAIICDRQSDAMKINIEVAENIIGAIIGPEGKALTDIARISGTNIKISKKGVFAPGTHNRIVTIRGDLNAIVIARYLIDRQITQEEAKRLQGNAVKFRR